ncbi:MAG: hypothetical protein AB202_03565 [Parcubacteria bacterium C7867-007]|nr:MAG: hypothetical protein AB202_03565 [Parcubacteria bacterium C7867-007]
MADIYNNPNGSSNNATPWIVGIVAIVVLVLLFMFFMPRNTETPATTGTTGAPQNTNPTILPAPVINNTTINATSTTVNSTSTRGTR